MREGLSLRGGGRFSRSAEFDLRRKIKANGRLWSAEKTALGARDFVDNCKA